MSWVAFGTTAVNIGAGIFGSRKAKKAAEQRAAAYGRAMGETERAYGAAQEYIDPRLEQEQSAMGRVNSLLGLDGEEVDYDVFRNTPGYQFQLDQGQQTIERSAAARGGLQSGNTLAAVTQYGQGLADQTFNNYLAQVMQLQNQGADRYSAGLEVDRGNRIADLTLGQGGARASGTEQSANQLIGAAEGVAGAFGSWGGWGGGSDKLQPVKLDPRVTNRYRGGGGTYG